MSFAARNNVKNASGWSVNANGTDLFFTERGGMSAPVRFTLEDGRRISPYLVTPWQTENKCVLGRGCLENLRGEFFCLPFGGNAEPVDGELHPCHGEISGEPWSFEGISEAGDSVSVKFSIEMKIRMGGKVSKTIRFDRGSSALYISDSVSGLTGKMPAGHHPIVRMPAGNAKMFLSTSNFEFGMVTPGIFSNPANQEYQYLEPGAEFQSLDRIPTVFKNPAFADYSVYPSPYGYCDLFSMFKKADGLPAWTCAVYPESGYLWFAMKNPAVLPATTIWTSNSGRFEAPWNGRTYCLGIEDGCAFFADGFKPSVTQNFLNERWIATAVQFPADIHVIQGVAPVDADFGKVAKVEFEEGSAIFVGESGKSVRMKLDWKFALK